jgi:hypothetical protein
MDERDMEEEGKNRKGKGWRIGINMFFFWYLFFWNCYLCLKKNVIRNRKARGVK